MKYLFKVGDPVILARYQSIMTCLVRGRHADGTMTVEDQYPKRGATTRFRVPQRELCALPPRAG